MTARQMAILRKMAEENEELVYERGVGYVDLEKVSGRTVFALLRACAISHDPYSATQGSGGMERYTINETGRQLLAAEQPTDRARPEGK